MLGAGYFVVTLPSAYDRGVALAASLDHVGGHVRLPVWQVAGRGCLSGHRSMLVTLSNGASLCVCVVLCDRGGGLGVLCIVLII